MTYFTYFWLSLGITALVLVAIAVASLIAVARYSGFTLHRSPQSRSTPLGVYKPRHVRYDVSHEDGIARARERVYVPAEPHEDTEKVKRVERGV